MPQHHHLPGAAVAAQTFYIFVLENLRQFGTLKAIGATTSDLARLLFVQAVLYGVLGSLLGLGLVATMIRGMRNPQLTPILPNEAVPLTTLVMTGVCLLASLLALQKVRKLEPAAVFR